MDLDSKVSCEACGYELIGMTGEGRCPECGERYDMVAGRGITRSSSAMRAHQRGDQVIYWMKFGGLAGGALLCVGVGALGSLAKQDPGPLAIGGVIASVLAFGAFVTWFTEGK